MSSEDKSRLARWAQRKAAVRERRGGAAPHIEKERADLPAGTAAHDEPKDMPHPTGQPGNETPELPDIESLDSDSDFTGFMKEGVPREMRRLALRKLWASDPMFNVIDEMVEYGEDYTDAATVVAGMKSAWEVGRGYARAPDEASGEEGIAAGEVSDGAAADEAAEAVDSARERAADSDVAADAPNAAEDEGTGRRSGGKA